ncbi:ATP-binding protein [Micromonospora sp. BQ11]|uniref:ATP-binding protein n=1 Tax=Micromonospora sp. BQ11 TaxID=3452212 RepID=UPI003F89646A
MDDIRVPLRHGTPASLVRRVAQQALRRWGLTDHADDVLLVATELVQNVTQHTDDGGELRMTVRDDAVLIEVTDTNPAPPHRRQPHPDEVGGRGMFLIASVARRWGTRPGVWAGRTGKIVWAEIVRRSTH